MARANRHFLPGYVWHITHRCHKKEFLLKFSRDRLRWRYWLYEATTRFGLCVLNYIVTSNHIHLLVKDTGKNAIPKSMQLIAGRTAQEYNQRKKRRGAFWEDRYHATAVDTDSHFFQCQTYIDLNMIRAGVVEYPTEWAHCGYLEILQPPPRYRVIDHDALLAITGLNSFKAYQLAHQGWLESMLGQPSRLKREAAWSESVAVGSETFSEELVKKLGANSKGRQAQECDMGYQVREPAQAYSINFKGEKGRLS